VDAGGCYSNRRLAVEKLISALNGEVCDAGADGGTPDDPLIDSAAERRRHTRTPFTPNEVAPVRTAYATDDGDMHA
jgi:hypothetical protein